MRVAFDENVPIAMVRVFETLAKQTQIQTLIPNLEVVSAKDFTPRSGDADYSPNNDAPWIKRFAASGGRVIISGNTRMQRVPHERLAMVQAGMIVIFFGTKWNGLKFFPKCALLMHWWPAVAKVATTAEAPSFWRIPSTVDLNGTLQRLSHEDQAKLKLDRQRSEQPAKAAVRKAKREAATNSSQMVMALEKSAK